MRAAAVGALAAAVIVPHVRRRLRLPAAATVVATLGGPLGLAVLWPRSKKRDLALFASQMWAFAVSHELPYDDPDRLRQRLRVHYPLDLDRRLGGGILPTARLQALIKPVWGGGVLARVLSWAHWVWFMEPYLALFWILTRHNDRFPRAARQMAAVFDLGCALYFIVPTAPPWWAAENGFTDHDVEKVHRVMTDIGEETFGPAWGRMFGTLGSNPWAAMPSLHFATSVMAAILLSEAGKVSGTLGWTYALTLGFALVYLGEHYVTDLLAGAGVVAVTRFGEPAARPAVLAFNGFLQRLEKVASA